MTSTKAPETTTTTTTSADQQFSHHDIYNPNQIANVYIIRIIERLTKIRHSTHMEILIILFMLSFQGVKGKFGEIVLKLFTFLVEQCPQALIKSIKDSFNCLSATGSSLRRKLIKPKLVPVENKSYVSLDSNLYTINMLHNFFSKNPDCIEHKNKFGIKQNSKSDITHTITYQNVNFSIAHEVIVTLLDELEITFDNTNVLNFKVRICLNKNIPVSNGQNINFEISTTRNLSNLELNKAFNYFFDETIKQYEITEKTDKLISVFYIKIQHTDKIQKVLNPDYTDWEEMMGKDRDKNSDSSPDSTKKSSKAKAPAPSAAEAPSATQASDNHDHSINYSRGEFIELFKMKPLKYLEEHVISYALECREINKIYKKLDTLYLRRRDKDKLTTMVDSFKNRKETYEQLGIPYKLGMLFHGPPGTGKTSAIKAIASYLNKSIYFVHLKTVKSNKQLKEIFEYINDKCNGGIIVFEDIDVACDIVASRSKVSDAGTSSPIAETSVADTISEENDDTLTLSYLLNLLDGTICREGTIFAITTNYLKSIDSAIYRPGRVDIKIEFMRSDHFQIREIYRAILDRDIPLDLLRQIPENKYTPSDIIFFIYQYMMVQDITDAEIVQELLDHVVPTE